MKVKEENADLINFYLKQGHKLTKKILFWWRGITVVYLSNVFLKEWEEISPCSHDILF